MSARYVTVYLIQNYFKLFFPIGVRYYQDPYGLGLMLSVQMTESVVLHDPFSIRQCSIAVRAFKTVDWFEFSDVMYDC